MDDTTFPKAGQHSVGVRAPALRGLGQKGQLPVRRVATFRRPQGPLPAVDAVVFAPRPAGSGRGAPRGTPGPNQGPDRPGVALAKRAPKAGRPGRVVVADCGYGISGPFRRELEARGLHYVVGVTEQMIVFAEAPRWEWPDPAVRGRSAPRRRPRLMKDAPAPVTLAELAARRPLGRVTWRKGTKGPLSARFAWLRVTAGLRLGGRRVRRGRAPRAFDRAA